MIRLNDGKPWFRRWMWIGFRPITVEGRFTQLLMAAGFLGFGLLSLAFAETVLAWLFAGLAVVSVLVGYAVVFRKLEGEF